MQLSMENPSTSNTFDFSDVSQCLTDIINNEKNIIKKKGKLLNGLGDYIEDSICSYSVIF